MTAYQPGILPPIPGHSRYLEYGLLPDADPRPALKALAARAVGEDMVVGLGPGLIQGLGRPVGGLRPFPAMTGPGCAVPSTQGDLWVWIRGEDRGHIAGRARGLAQVLRPAFRRDRQTDGFKFGRGLDLSGYEDGTENPEGKAAPEAFLLRRSMPWAHAGGEGLMFVAFGHSLDALFRFTRPLTGSYFWCPPVAGGRLDLAAVGI